MPRCTAARCQRSADGGRWSRRLPDTTGSTSSSVSTSAQANNGPRTQRGVAAIRREDLIDPPDLFDPPGVIDPIGSKGTARPTNAIRGQKLLDATASTTPTSARTIAIDHTTALNQVGAADSFALLMPEA